MKNSDVDPMLDVSFTIFWQQNWGSLREFRYKLSEIV